MGNLKKRVMKAEERFGINKDVEMIELPLPGGRIGRMTQSNFDKFLAWLQERAEYGKEAIEKN